MLNDKNEWEDVISNIARVNSVLPEAIIVGGTASALLYTQNIEHLTIPTSLLKI